MIHDPLTTILLLLAAVAVLVIGDFAILRNGALEWLIDRPELDPRRP